MEFFNQQPFRMIILIILTIFCFHLFRVSSSIPIQHQHIKNAGESLNRMRRSTLDQPPRDEIITHSHNIYDEYLVSKLGRAAYLYQQARTIRDRVQRQVPYKKNPEYQNGDWLYDHDRVRRVATSNQILKESSRPTANARPIVISNEIRKESSSVPPNGGRNNSPTSPSNNITSPSVYVVSGVSKYSVLHVVPPNGIQVREIRPYDDQQPQPPQRLLLGTTSMKRSSGGADGGSGSNKTGLAIVLIEFDVSDDEDYTYETMLEVVE